MDPPDRPRRRWLAWGLGCAAVALVVCCGGPAVGLIWLRSFGEQLGEKQRQENLDRVFHMLGDGDGAAAFDRADERFRAAHPREAVIQFFAARPRLRDRNRLRVGAAL